MSKLSKIFLKCKDCSNEKYFEYEFLNSINKDDRDLDFSNFNQILYRFKCSMCQTKNLTIQDCNRDLIFDTQNSVSCRSCDLPIPFPRLHLVPGTQVCTTCKNLGTALQKNVGTIFPEVPREIRGKCPQCDKKFKTGLVVVYQNSKTKTFFLGCSIFPKCKWSSDDYFDELNNIH